MGARLSIADPIRAVTRGLAVIEALNESPVTSLATLHLATGLPKPSLVRLLATLIEGGYVVRVSRSEGYALTDAVLRLASGVRERDRLVEVARPLMEDFTRRHKWQVSLATSETDVVRVRFSTRHISPFSREENFLNRCVPMLQSAVGRAYFAFCSEDERAFVLSLRQAAEDTLEIERRPAAVAAMVAEVRACGYATTERPRTDPTRSFAVPILDPGRPESPFGSLALFYYASALTKSEALERYLEPLRALAGEIAAGLDGGRPCAVRPASSS